MRLTWITFGSLRRPVLAGLVLAFAFVLGAASGAFAQAAPTQPAPAQAPAPEKPALAFKADAGLIILYIKPDKTADFEDLMNKLKDALAKSEAPEAKQQAASMKLFKSTAPNPQMTIYVLMADPIVKDVEYLVPPDPLQGLSERRAGPVREVAGHQGQSGPAHVRPRAGPEVPVSAAQAPRGTGPSVRSLACSSRSSRPDVPGGGSRPPLSCTARPMERHRRAGARARAGRCPRHASASLPGPAVL